MLYGDWIGRWGKSCPEVEALVDIPRNQRLTYGELNDQVNRLAYFLSLRLGIAKGDRVAVLAYNRADYIALFLAAGRLGAILVPLNFRLAVDEFYYFFQDAAPRAFFFDRDHLETVRELQPRLKVDHFVCLDPDEELGPSLASDWDRLPADPPPEVDLKAGDPQLIIYTSGTTGLPKGVILTYGMITWNSINTHLGWGLRRGERTILHSALFYTAGWNVFTLPLFHGLGTNILIHRFEADLILELIERERVTVFFAVPTMYQMLIDSPRFPGADCSSIRFLVSGGAPLTEKIFQTFQREKGLHLREGYGLTEAGPNLFMADGKLKTVGRPMPHVDLKLIGTDGKPPPAGGEGELLVRGDMLCAGYWNKPEATAEAFQNGWFSTGDLAQVEADGHYRIVGRKKDMFISGGVNIYPAEIERCLETHPRVAAVAVIGVPDDKWGEVGKVCLVTHPGEQLSLEELQGFLRDKIAKYKIPKYGVVLETLPRTVASEKVQKFILKERHGRADNL
ncbi:MAG: AMP-binding protein [Deltaproteobacteria bacterium]|nr:AMP-binding protein [Deltaproteobacteria bacterium]